MTDCNITEFQTNINKHSCVCTCFPLMELKEPAKGVEYVIIITVSAITILTLIPGIILNTLVLIAYRRNRQLQIWSNKTLMALAIIDWLVCAIALPLYVIKKIAEVYTRFHCILWAAFRILPPLGFLASLTTNALISVEWFLTLAYPLRYQTIITEKRRKIIFAVSFTVMFLAPVSQMFQNNIGLSAGIYSTFIISFLLVITATWFWIHRLTLRHKRQIRALDTCSNLEKIVKNTKTCYLVVGSSMICFLPSFALLLFDMIISDESQLFYISHTFIHPFFDIILNMNSLLNPVILLYRKRDFRETVKRLLS